MVPTSVGASSIALKDPGSCPPSVHHPLLTALQSAEGLTKSVSLAASPDELPQSSEALESNSEASSRWISLRQDEGGSTVIT